MGKNTQDRQNFIIENLRVEKDIALTNDEMETEKKDNNNIDKAS